jgi:hypothetical protein
MLTGTTLNEILQRRFGSLHAAPCQDPNVLTCTLFGCQSARYCQKGNASGTGTQIVHTPAGRAALEEKQGWA